MKTIFFLSKNFPPMICGVGDYTYELYVRLKNRGYQVRVITGVSPEVKNFAKENKIEKDVYPIISEWNFLCIKKIVALLREEKADWFCIQYVPYSYCRLGLPFYLIFLQILVKLNGINTCIFFHEVAVRSFFNGFRAFALSMAQRFIGYCLYIPSKFSFTNNILYQPYFKPFRILAIPIPANLYGENEICMNRNKKGTYAKIKLTSFINRCNRQVIESVAHCINIDKLNIDLTIIGLGTKKIREEVMEYISVNNIGGSVFFYNNFNKADIAHSLYSTDIFLQLEHVSKRGKGGISSKSGVTAAAMAAGLPVIGSFGDMTDPVLYKNGENILFTESCSAVSIGKCIHQLYWDESLRLRLSINAIKTYDSYFSWDKTIKSYIVKFGYG